MAVTMGAAQQLDERSWLLTWSSDLGGSPTFYVYQDGRLIDTTTATSKVFSAEIGESIVVEVLDDPSEVPETAFPGRLTLSWKGVSGADSYRIEEYVSGSWTQRATVKDEGQGYFRWLTRFLEDDTTHQFRITAVGTNGNDGAPRALTCLMVRHPDVPDVNMDYDGAGPKTITISAA